MTTLQASIRTENGKGEARKLRSNGQVPAVVYGPETRPIAIAVDPAGITEIFKQTQNRNTIVELNVDGETVPVLVREVQRHPVSRELLHVDFYRVSKERDVEIMVPLRPHGRPRGAVLGGRLRVIRRELRARCRYDRIPNEFTVDVSPLNIGDMIKASEIEMPPGVELVMENDFNVVTLYGKRVAGGTSAAAELEEEPAGGEDEGAEGEAAEGEGTE